MTTLTADIGCLYCSQTQTSTHAARLNLGKFAIPPPPAVEEPTESLMPDDLQWEIMARPDKHPGDPKGIISSWARNVTRDQTDYNGTDIGGTTIINGGLQ